MNKENEYENNQNKIKHTNHQITFFQIVTLTN